MIFFDICGRLPPTMCVAGRLLGGASKFDCIKVQPNRPFEYFIFFLLSDASSKVMDILGW
jgi:hypothetical protein